MAISPLPPSTVRLLGSSVNIPTPPALVKEFLDNAIDAGANHVEILVSANTVDRIQVRDNGQGIAVEDFDSLGCRAHTSKLRNFEELQTRGGKTLGFRGEALASANCVAAALHITTRTAGDPVASRVRLRPGVGGVQDRRPVSGQVGTTVTVERLFEMIPVRRQHAVKDSRKSLARIRDVLHAYVLARPYLKLSLNVLGEPKMAWSYSPSSPPTVRDAVLQIFGRDLAIQCDSAVFNMSIGGSENSNRLSRRHDFVLEAFIPTPKCDANMIKGKGAYISIDSRPVSSTQGTAKRILAAFKSHCSSALGCSKQISAPFMQLNIRCSLASYDPNVAPLKDEVLFEDERGIMDCFEKLCRKVYGSPIEEESATCSTRPGQQPQEINVEGTPERTAACPMLEPMLHIEPTCLTDDNGGKDTSHLSDHLPGPLTTTPSNLANLRGNDTHNREFQQNEQQGQNSPLTNNILTPSSDNRKGQDGTLPAVVRTAVKVDLSRKASNTTDEDSMDGTITIQIPENSTRETMCNLSMSRRKSSMKPPSTIHKMENIHRYFQPEPQPTFQIATNDTATKGGTLARNSSSQSLVSNSKNPKRAPLQPVRDSVLNKMQGQMEQRSESPSWDLEILRPFHAPSGDLDEPAQRRHLAVGLEDSRRGMTRVSPSPPFSPPDLPVRPGAPLTMPSLEPVRQHVSTWQTPPSSGSLPTSGLSRSSIPPLRSIRAENMAGPSRRRSRIAEQTTDRNVSPRAQRHSRGLEESFQSQNIDTSCVLGEDPWAHTTQVLLMRTPPPRIDPGATTGPEERESASVYEYYSPLRKRSTPVPESMRQKYQRTISGSSVGLDGAVGDPRQYLISRKRSEARSGRPKRMRSVNLPLETVMKDLETGSLTTHLASSPLELLQGMQHLASFDPYATTGDAHHPLNFRSMIDVTDIDDRLRLTVEAWLERQGMDVKVDFTLHSRAKGKQKA